MNWAENLYLLSIGTWLRAWKMLCGIMFNMILFSMKIRRGISARTLICFKAQLKSSLKLHEKIPKLNINANLIWWWKSQPSSSIDSYLLQNITQADQKILLNLHKIVTKNPAQLTRVRFYSASIKQLPEYNNYFPKLKIWKEDVCSYGDFKNNQKISYKLDKNITKQ